MLLALVLARIILWICYIQSTWKTLISSVREGEGEGRNSICSYKNCKENQRGDRNRKDIRQGEQVDSYFLVSHSWLVPRESRLTWLGCSKSPLIKLLEMQQKQRSLRIEQIIGSKGLPKITVLLGSKISLLNYIWAALLAWDLHCDQGFCIFK